MPFSGKMAFSPLQFNCVASSLPWKTGGWWCVCVCVCQAVTKFSLSIWVNLSLFSLEFQLALASVFFHSKEPKSKRRLKKRATEIRRGEKARKQSEKIYTRVRVCWVSSSNIANIKKTTKNMPGFFTLIYVQALLYL